VPEEEKIPCEKMKEVLLHISNVIISNADYLTDLDRACGDGDFGVGMLRGFTNVRQQVENYEGCDVGEMMMKSGFAITATVGGAAGPVFGALFSSAGMKLKGKKEVGLAELAKAFIAALDMIMKLGGAKPGDKTMVDALAPAVEALEEASRAGSSLREAFSNASKAAKRGAEATKEMVAKKGKASYLGEKTLGYPDPGAVAVALIFKAISEKL